MVNRWDLLRAVYVAKRTWRTTTRSTTRSTRLYDASFKTPNAQRLGAARRSHFVERLSSRNETTTVPGKPRIVSSITPPIAGEARSFTQHKLVGRWLRAPPRATLYRGQEPKAQQVDDGGCLSEAFVDEVKRQLKRRSRSSGYSARCPPNVADRCTPSPYPLN